MRPSPQLPLFVGRHQAPRLQASAPLVVDGFAGGGGASSGIEAAIGRPVDIALNHDPRAIEMHARNHPETRHYIENIWRVDPREACQGRPVDLAWFSPDCRHFSRASGKAKRDPKVRSLAWVVVQWAKLVRPRLIFLENVEEFLSWGPIDAAGEPIKAKAGATFKVWLGKLRAQGYAVEWRILDAAAYGAPTHRKRLFLVARRDGEAIEWPAPTHGPGLPHPYRTAAECMDFDSPCPSIFDRSRPLAENTMRRIAYGLDRYVINARDPFFVAALDHTAAPYLVPRYGERPTQAPRARSIERPAPTIVGTANGGSLVAAFMSKHYGGPNGHLAIGQDLRRPAPTLTSKDSSALTVAHLLKYYGTANGQRIDAPLGTQTTRHRFAEVRTLLDRHGIAGERLAIADVGMRMLAPRELFRCQGFTDAYWIDGLTQADQVRLCGNSVPPQVAAAVVAANCQPTQGRKAA